jgi:hypothetical protein
MSDQKAAVENLRDFSKWSVADRARHFGGHLFLCREPDRKDRATCAFVLTGNLAAVILDHSVNCAEAETCAFPDRLGGIEGIEDTLWLANARP